MTPPNEPTYHYVKGHGWVPETSGKPDFSGKWIKHPKALHRDYWYPQQCESWDIIDNTTMRLKVGDIVPWPAGTHVWYITKILDEGPRFIKFEYEWYDCEGVLLGTNITKVHNGYSCVVRRT